MVYLDKTKVVSKVKRVYKSFVKRTLVKVYPYLPKEIRWGMANKHHIKYKHFMLEKYGEKRYLELYDEKAYVDLKHMGFTKEDFKGLTVVDIGSGMKGILDYINAKKKISVDPSIKEEIKNKMSLPDDIEYRDEKIEETKIETHSIDVAVCINTLNHVEDWKKALRQIHRILKPNGLFLFEIYVEPLALGHTYKFECNRIIYKIIRHGFKLIKEYHIPSMNHEVTNEKVNPRCGGVFVAE